MNSIKIEADCGVITLQLELRGNDVSVAKTQIDKFLEFSENLWEEEGMGGV